MRTAKNFKVFHMFGDGLRTCAPAKSIVTSQEVTIRIPNLPGGYYRDLQTSDQSMCSNGRLAIETCIKNLRQNMMSSWLNESKWHSTSGSSISSLRGAWRDRDPNDIFAHCSLIFYFLDFKFSNFVCPSELHTFIWSFFKNSFRKKKNIQKNHQKRLTS